MAILYVLGTFKAFFGVRLSYAYDHVTSPTKTYVDIQGIVDLIKVKNLFCLCSDVTVAVCVWVAGYVCLQ